MFVLWSISRSLGRVGVGAQAHVGDGQLGTVGNGGAFDLVARDRCAPAKRGLAPLVRRGSNMIKGVPEI